MFKSKLVPKQGLAAVGALPVTRVSFAKRYYRFLILVGIEPLRIIYTLRALPEYVRNYRSFRRLESDKYATAFPVTHYYPVLTDRTASAGTARGAYFHQDLLVARRIFENKPAKHIDIGSRIDGFVAHVASFREIEVLDIRVMPEKLHNIRFRQADFMQEPFPLTDACDSVSCLHALEHFGLGRYGDPVDIDGHLRGFRNLHRILRTGGTCYLSVPLGPQRTEFDAHRVFSLAYLLRMFTGKFHVDRFSFVDDSGALHKDAMLTEKLIVTNAGCRFGCAIFELTKQCGPEQDKVDPELPADQASRQISSNSPGGKCASN